MSITRLFRILVRSATVLAFAVVVFGAFVRLSDAGLGCPDWPGCYGHVSVPTSQAALAKATERYPGSAIQARKAWIEMIHRYLAGTLGLMVLAIGILAWRARLISLQSPLLPSVLVALIVVQALFGMWTVTLKLMPIVVTLHLLGGMTTLAVLAWLTSRHGEMRMARDSTEATPVNVRAWAAAGLAVLFVQIALGGWVSTNYAGMACVDVPLCNGTLIPNMNFADGFTLWRELGMTASGVPLSDESLSSIQWVHRAGAMVTVCVLGVVGLISLPFAALRGFGFTVFGLALFQASLGLANVVYVLPVPLAVAHNACAALLLVMLVMLNFRANFATRREI